MLYNWSLHFYRNFHFHFYRYSEYWISIMLNFLCYRLWTLPFSFMYNGILKICTAQDFFLKRLTCFQLDACIWKISGIDTFFQKKKEIHQRFTRKTCSISCRISSSLNTFRTSSLSMHCCLFMYFMAYIFSVSFFCTMHT